MTQSDATIRIDDAADVVVVGGRETDLCTAAKAI